MGNISGFSWVFIQPIITLIIYTVVFEKIFQARIPEAENIGFIVYLAIGFWPWLAFSESLVQAITSVTENKALIGKIRLDFKILVISKITATFAINTIGYLVVLILLIVFGYDFNYSSLPLLIIPMTQLYILSLSMGLILAALQVYIKDTIQVFTTLVTLWFFLTPIIYSESILPEKYKSIIQLNPLYIPITFIHRLMITDQQLNWLSMIYFSIFLGLFLFISIKFFNKLSSNFIDFV